MNVEKEFAAESANTIIISCPHCLACSITLSAKEYLMVERGQQMVEVCQVCGKEVVFNG